MHKRSKFKLIEMLFCIFHFFFFFQIEFNVSRRLPQSYVNDSSLMQFYKMQKMYKNTFSFFTFFVFLFVCRLVCHPFYYFLFFLFSLYLFLMFSVLYLFFCFSLRFDNCQLMQQAFKCPSPFGNLLFSFTHSIDCFAPQVAHFSKSF